MWEDAQLYQKLQNLGRPTSRAILKYDPEVATGSVFRTAQDVLVNTSEGISVNYTSNASQAQSYNAAALLQNEMKH
jgi:hypothetical protein